MGSLIVSNLLPVAMGLKTKARAIDNHCDSEQRFVECQVGKVWGQGFNEESPQSNPKPLNPKPLNPKTQTPKP